MLLPHDRVGSDFSWLQAHTTPPAAVAVKVEELEDEESFLYGNEDARGKRADGSSAALLASFPQGSEQADRQEAASAGGQQHQQSRSILADLDSSEFEKIRNILKSLGSADVSEMMVKMQPSAALPASDRTAAGLALPALRNPNVRLALESLQSLIRGQSTAAFVFTCLHQRLFTEVIVLAHFFRRAKRLNCGSQSCNRILL